VYLDQLTDAPKFILSFGQGVSNKKNNFLFRVPLKRVAAKGKLPMTGVDEAMRDKRGKQVKFRGPFVLLILFPVQERQQHYSE
jgi:hypothetical protein